MRRLLLCLFMLGLPMTAQAQSKCSLQTPDNCRNTNQLMWAPGTDKAIQAFLKGVPGNFLFDRPKVSAAQDLEEVLGGPPDDPVALPGGMKLFTACRAHSCDEKGAMVLKPGHIAALAILHMNCGKKNCDNDFTLTTFLGKAASDPIGTQAIEAWAKKAVADGYTPAGLHKPILAHQVVTPIDR